MIVRHCTFAHGHGTVVIGSEMSGGVRNVLAEDLTADGTDAGVSIKSRRGRGGIVENIVYRNLSLKNITKQAITIDMNYDVGNNPDVDQSGPEGVPIFRDITIENLTCDGAADAIQIRGLQESPVQGVTLNNIHIKATRGIKITDADEIKKADVDVQVSSPTTGQ